MNIGSMMIILPTIQILLILECSVLIDNGVASRRRKRVWKGIEVTPHANPWLGYLSGCTAFLINGKDDVFKFDNRERMSDIAITAAHCVDHHTRRRKGFYYFTQTNLPISFGKHNITVKNEAHQIDIQIVKTICHWKFNELDQFEYDIAMLKLEKPVKFNQFVRPLALSRFALNDVDGCFVSGWGGAHSLRMSRFNKSHLTNDNTTFYQFDTVKHNLDEVYQGDSGSPLVCYKDGQYIAQALVSNMGFTNGILEFTNIVELLDWISAAYKEIIDPHYYSYILISYNHFKAIDESLITQLLNYYISGIYNYIPENFYLKFNLIFNYSDIENQWLDPEFGKCLKFYHDTFYLNNIAGYEIVSNASTCAVLCFLEKRGAVCTYVLATMQCFFSTDLNVDTGFVAKMPQRQSLVIEIRLVPMKLASQNQSAFNVMSMGSKFPKLEISHLPWWNFSISQRGPDFNMFHCIGTLHGHFNKSNIVEHSPSCLMKLFPEYKAHVSAIILNMINAKKYNVKFHRVTNNGDDHYESMTLNYTMDKNPTFRSYNPFTGGFLAQPNTMPWIVSLSFGYAVLLNESEISGIGREDRTRFVLTTGPCISNSSEHNYASAGSYFKDLHGHFKQTQKIVGSHVDAELKLRIYELIDDIIFNDQVQPLSLGINKYINLQSKSLFTVKYDTNMTHIPLTFIPLQTDLLWLNTGAEDIPLRIQTKRPFQYKNIDIPDKEITCSPLIACDEVTQTCDLIGLWNSSEDAEIYFTIAPHFNWMNEVLWRAMLGDW